MEDGQRISTLNNTGKWHAGGLLAGALTLLKDQE